MKRSDDHDIAYMERVNRYKHLPRYPDKDMSWHTMAQEYLKKITYDEYNQGLQAWLKRGRSKKTYRYRPSRYVDDLVNALGRNDKEMFYGMKLKATIIPDSMKD